MATTKPEIQYVGQFYVYGSEAQAVAVKRRPQFQLPKPKLELEKIEKIYVDPVALIGLAVALVMLVCMVVGACQIHSSWQEYKQMSHYLSVLQQENARLEHNYHISYDMAEVEAKALAMGMVSVDQIPAMSVRVTVPAPEVEETAWDEFVWFVKGLFA